MIANATIFAPVHQDGGIESHSKGRENPPHARVTFKYPWYDNALPAMRALFVAHGPAFRPGVVVPEFPNVDVYPLLARLVTVQPERNDGHVEDVLDMLRPGF